MPPPWISALRIANCVGCFGCWTKTPGRCVIRDDAARVYPLIARSEQVLYVSRVKYGSYAPVMKTMLERAIPVQQAFLRIHNGETHHVQRAVVPQDAVILAYGADRAEERALFTGWWSATPTTCPSAATASALWPRGSWRPPWERRWPGGEASDRKRQPPRPRPIPGATPSCFRPAGRGEARYAALTAKESRRAGGGCGGLHRPAAGLPPSMPTAFPPLSCAFWSSWRAGPEHRPRISVLINCGFLEPHQNDVAVDMVRLFCLENGYPFGACLKIGGGEAILGTPFRLPGQAEHQGAGQGRRRRTVRRAGGHHAPVPRSFVRASTRYWTQMGAANGCTPEQMASMDIEPQP